MTNIALVTPVMLALVPVVVGITEVIKPFTGDSRYSPLIAIGLGILGVFLLPHETTTGMSVLGGIVVGLTSSGLYSGTQRINTTIKEITN